MTNRPKKIITLLLLVVALLLCFDIIYRIATKSSVNEPKQEIEVVYRDSIIPKYEYQTIEVPKEFKIVKYDTITTIRDSVNVIDSIVYTEVADTLAIIKDYLKVREYSEIIYLNSCPIYFDAKVQYNKLQDYKIVGRCKPEVVYKNKPFGFTTLIGYNTIGNFTLEAVVDVKNVAVGYEYELREKPVSTLKIGYRF